MTIKEVSKIYDIPIDTLRYYERMGMIPPVHRTSSGIRDYQETDINWVQLAKCMRSAGLPVEAMAEYRRLFELGNETIPDRLHLLEQQRETLLAQRRAIDEMLDKLNYKIARYEVAAETGVLTWDEGK